MRRADSGNWRPGRMRGVMWAVMGLFAPKRTLLARHFARYDEDPVYRAQWKAVLERGYRGARSTDTSTPFASRWPRSADADTLGDLPQMRARCRELGRDDPVGAGILRAWTEGVVGTGVEDRASLGDSTKENAIDKVWQRLRKALFPAELLHWSKAQRVMASSALTDGEYLVVRYYPKGKPVKFELVEADRLLTPLDADPEDEAGWIRDGIERDRHGAIVAYWIAKHHPGDTSVAAVVKGKTPTIGGLVKADFDRVLVRDCKHVKQGVPRPGQSRSPSILHAVIQDLRDLDLLIVAVLKRVQVAASFAAFIKTREDLLTVAQATAKKHGFRLDQDLIPGMIFKLAPGEEIQTVNPNFPMPDLDVFVRLLARRIGTALGVSWQIVLSDFSEANYSSAKADDRRAEQSYSIARQDLVECFRWMRLTALEDALMRGEQELLEAGVSAEDLDEVMFIAPSRNVLLDAEKENKADLLAVQGKLLSKKRVRAARGIDSEAEDRQIAMEELREQELRKELGLDAMTSAQQADERASILKAAWPQTYTEAA